MPTSIHHHPSIVSDRPRRRLGVIALVGVLLATVMVVAAGPVAAHAPNTNGCTLVPDRGFGFDFHDICDAHDICYGTQPDGSGWLGRRACDREFRSQMLDHCGLHPAASAERVTCTTVAWAYYFGVRTFGRPFWDQTSPTRIA